MSSTREHNKTVEDTSDQRNLSRDDSDAGDEESRYFQSGSGGGGEISFGELEALTPPPRVLSSNSLYGEDIMSSSRLSSGRDNDFIFSPSLLSQSDAASPPQDSIHSQLPSSLSPPPLQNETRSFASKNSQKRPPRAPSVHLRFSSSMSAGAIPPSKMSMGQHQQHNRASSSGDASFLSALTDSSFDMAGLYPLPISHSLKQVSWDQQADGGPDVSGMNINIPQSIQQPILDDDDVVDGEENGRPQGNPVRQSLAGIYSLEHNVSDNQIDSQRNPPPMLSDARSPFEDEAEAVLRQVIEEDMKTKRENVDHRLSASISFETEGVISGENSDPLKEEKTEADNDETEDLASATTRLFALQRALAKENLVDSHIPVSRSTDANAVGSDAELLYENAERLKSSVRRRRSSQSKVVGKNTMVSRDKEGDTIQQSSTEQETVKSGNGGCTDDLETGRSTPKALYLAAKTKEVPARIGKVFTSALHELQSDWEDFDEFLKPKRTSIKAYLSGICSFLILPGLIVSSILFYGADNPPTGKGDDADRSRASSSWWVLFVAVRQVVTFSLARGVQHILVNYLALSSPTFARIMGSKMCMVISQSKGWPCILFLFGLFDILLLYGGTDFANHWGFWQDWIGMFSEENPAGQITESDMYLRFLIVFLVVSTSVSIKRVWIGLHLGRRLHGRYYEQVTDMMERMMLLSEIAAFSREGSETANDASSDLQEFYNEITSKQTWSPGQRKETARSSKNEFTEILDPWEEPEGHDRGQDVASLKDILQLRQAYQMMQAEFPFSVAFGRANTRYACAESAARVFARLVSRQVDQERLHFSTLHNIALGGDGKVKPSKLKNLACMLSPDTTGYLTLGDFIRSVDVCYRDLRLLCANIRNSTSIDRAYEKILNIGFYFVLGIVCLTILGIDPLAFFVALSTSLVAFAFIIGTASSQYFEGVLLILVRRPYDIGDRIHVSNAEFETDTNGSSGWIVEKIDLFTTTVRLGPSREVATLANGALARSRIINMNRSDKALVSILLKFGVDVPYQKIVIFKKAVQRFVHERPREWIQMISFRSTRIEGDLGFVEYVIALQSPESWQRPLPILEARASVASFCLELQKKLGMRYIAPPLPVNLSVGDGAHQKFAMQHDQEDEDRRGSLAFSQKTETENGAASVSELSPLNESIKAIARLFENKKTK